MRILDKKRFNALVNHSKSPFLEGFGEEFGWYSNEDESLLGVFVLDLIDHDYSCAILGKDEVGKYRAIEITVSNTTLEELFVWMIEIFTTYSDSGQKIFPQGDNENILDFFKLIVSEEKQHPFFKKLNEDIGQSAAKEIIQKLMLHFIDIDGNYIEQFQSNGFDARLWELYLNTYFYEENLYLNRDYHAPDFLVEKFGYKVAIEAVIVGRKEDTPIENFEERLRESSFEEDKERLKDEIPIKFGSPLFSKLKKEYWKLSNVANNPLVFAIADFHDNMAMTWTGSALHRYLYGVHHEHTYNDEGEPIITPLKIETHKFADKEIPSGFFFQEDAENISAILFSASGTLSKFNRMGHQAGLGDKKVKLIRSGFYHKHDENASMTNFISYEVGIDSNESWAEGISMFHNPNAKFPVPEGLFPSIAHHHFKDGQIVSILPDIHPYSTSGLVG